MFKKIVIFVVAMLFATTNLMPTNTYAAENESKITELNRIAQTVEAAKAFISCYWQLEPYRSDGKLPSNNPGVIGSSESVNFFSGIGTSRVPVTRSYLERIYETQKVKPDYKEDSMGQILTSCDETVIREFARVLGFTTTESIKRNFYCNYFDPNGFSDGLMAFGQVADKKFTKLGSISCVDGYTKYSDGVYLANSTLYYTSETDDSDIVHGIRYLIRLYNARKSAGVPELKIQIYYGGPLGGKDFDLEYGDFGMNYKDGSKAPTYYYSIYRDNFLASKTCWKQDFGTTAQTNSLTMQNDPNYKEVKFVQSDGSIEKHYYLLEDNNGMYTSIGDSMYEGDNYGNGMTRGPADGSFIGCDDAISQINKLADRIGVAQEEQSSKNFLADLERCRQASLSAIDDISKKEKAFLEEAKKLMTIIQGRTFGEAMYEELDAHIAATEKDYPNETANKSGSTLWGTLTLFVDDVKTLDIESEEAVAEARKQAMTFIEDIDAKQAELEKTTKTYSTQWGQQSGTISNSGSQHGMSYLYYVYDGGEFYNYTTKVVDGKERESLECYGVAGQYPAQGKSKYDQFRESVAGIVGVSGITYNSEEFISNTINHSGDHDYDNGDNDFVFSLTTTSADTCEGSAGLGWILCPVTKFVVQTADSLYEKVANKWIQVKTEYTNSEGVRSAWSTFVGFANIILVILFLFIIFSQLTGFGIDNYGIKRALPKIIVVAVLINLSFIICQLAVDVTNILGANFEGLFDAIQIPKSTVPATGDPLPSILGNLLAIGGLAVAGVTVFTAVRSGGLGKFVAGLLIPLLITFLVALIGIFFFFVIMGIRQAGIVTLIAVSPVAIVCYALPNTKKYFDRWFNGFKGLILVYPICGLMLGASRMVARLISSVGEQDLATNMVACAVLVFPFFVIPQVITRAVSAITQLGEKVAQLGRGIRQRADKGIRNSEAYKHAEEGWKQAGEERRRSIRKALDRKEQGKYSKRRKALDKRLKAIESDNSLTADEKFNKARIEEEKFGRKYGARINQLNKDLTAANMQDAENLKPIDEISFEIAQLRVAAKREGEKYQGYKDQHSQENKDTLKRKIGEVGNAITKESAAEQSVDIRAMTDTMAKNGDIEDLMDGLYSIADWKMLASDGNARANIVSALAGSGSQMAKGYAKYLEKMGQNGLGDKVVSFKEWIKDGDSNHDNILAESGLNGWQKYSDLKFDGDPYANMQKDELKFIKNHQKDDLKYKTDNMPIGQGDLAAITQGALNKSGEERVIMNQMLEQTVAGLASKPDMSLDDKIKALKLSPDSLTKMDMGNMNAIFDGLIRDSSGNKLEGTAYKDMKKEIIAKLQPLATAAAGDKRIRNKMTDDMRELFNIKIEQTGNPPQNGGPTMGDRSSSSYDGDESGY